MIIEDLSVIAKWVINVFNLDSVKEKVQLNEIGKVDMEGKAIEGQMSSFNKIES